jgi:hypothetical protein
MRKVVVTGLGLVTPLGIGTYNLSAALWPKLIAYEHRCPPDMAASYRWPLRHHEHQG